MPRPPYFIIFLALAALPLCANSQHLPTLDKAGLTWLGERIFRNECNNKPECLTSWNQGENFPSLGIGHFIWYRANQSERFTESFPDLLSYLQAQSVVLPTWLAGSNPEQPWPDRGTFLAAQQDSRLQELRQFLLAHQAEQTAFIITRFEQGLQSILRSLPATERRTIQTRIDAIAATAPPSGLYALIDYVHFKGDGMNATERYMNQGWGLLQVLQAMPDSTGNSLQAFVDSARSTLARRVRNAPPERNEQRWLQGWNNRLTTYLPDAQKHPLAGADL